jgi:hypothetical protein
MNYSSHFSPRPILRLRFPDDFMFQLTKKEAGILTFQFGMSSSGGHGGRRTRPFVFTEQGVAMLSTVLNSQRAIKVNIAIMRAFVNLRERASIHRDHTARLDALEQHFEEHEATIKHRPHHGQCAKEKSIA